MVGSNEGRVEGGFGGACRYGLLEMGRDPQAHKDGGLLACKREAGTGLGQPKHTRSPGLHVGRS